MVLLNCITFGCCAGTPGCETIHHRIMTAANQTEGTKPKARRYGFVDHFRGWAVLVMIETHAVNAWMADSVRSQQWYSYLKLINGFVAPSFLFIAGVSFLIVARKRFDSISRFTPDFFRQLRRFAWIWVLGYILHLPGIVLRGWIPIIPLQNLQGLYRVDILQTIAFCLVALMFLCVLMQDLRRVLIAALALAVGALVATPFLWQIDFAQILHPAAANYLNGLHNPLFPLFPWCVFLFGGAVTGGFFFERAAANDESGAILKIMLCGMLLFAAAFLGQDLQVIPYQRFWTDSPQWVVMRLGIVMTLFGIFWYLETRGVRGSALTLLLGTESLFVYAVHLVMIYSITGETAWFPVLGYRAFSPLRVSLLLTALLALVILLTWLWIRLWSLRAARVRG